MIEPAIVIIAYNRAAALTRLLQSVKNGDYSGYGSIRLIISIDKGDNADVIEAAESFIWEHGEKTILKRNRNMGLKAHVLACSEMAVEYGGAIVLEDDLYVARDYYRFAVHAMAYSETDDRIAGVSLYNHLMNVHAREPFEALNDGFDNWYFQFASSWGQAYTAKQWLGFSEWMKQNDNTPFPNSVPYNVSSWDDRSWLKYFIRYVVETNKFFLYPRVSRTTNFSEEGTHRAGQAADFQVSLMYDHSREYSFITLDESFSVYDAYFENIHIREQFRDVYPEMITDLYGKKPIPDKGFFLSSKVLPYKIVCSFGRLFRPIEANIIHEIPGDAFRIYDIEHPAKAVRSDEADKLLYNYRAFKSKYGLQIIWKRIKGK